MRYVGVGRRFLAVAVDSIISLVWMFPFLEIDQGPGYFRVELDGGGTAAYVAITLVYFTAMEAQFGATIGKFAAGIRVVPEHGGRIDGTAAVIRNVGRIVDVLPTAYLIGAIAVWTSSTRQRLGDRWAKTVVVEASSVGASPPDADTRLVPPAPVPAPTARLAPPPIPPPPPVPGGGDVGDPTRSVDDVGDPTRSVDDAGETPPARPWT
jgi:uncharacterized RDD family membrane protein YckC